MTRGKCHITRQAIELLVEGTRLEGRLTLKWLDKIKTVFKVLAQIADAQDRVR